MASDEKSAQDAKNKKKHGTQHRSKPDDGEDRRPAPEFTALINAVAQENRADREQRQRQDRRREWREWVTIIVVLVAATAAVAQAVIFNEQLGEMIVAGRQAEKAVASFQIIAEGVPKTIQIISDYARDVQQAAINNQQIIRESRRPLISIDANVSNPLTLSLTRGIATRAIFVVRNDGQADTKASIAVNMFLQTEARPYNIAAEQNAACKEARKKEAKEIKASGGAVQEGFALGVKFDELRKGLRSDTETKNFIFFPVYETVKHVTPIVVGCAEYGTEKAPHQVKFFGNLIRTNAKESRFLVTGEPRSIGPDELAVEIIITSSN